MPLRRRAGGHTRRGFREEQGQRSGRQITYAPHFNQVARLTLEAQQTSSGMSSSFSSTEMSHNTTAEMRPNCGFRMLKKAVAFVAVDGRHGSAESEWSSKLVRASVRCRCSLSRPSESECAAAEGRPDFKHNWTLENANGRKTSVVDNDDGGKIWNYFSISTGDGAKRTTILRFDAHSVQRYISRVSIWKFHLDKCV